MKKVFFFFVAACFSLQTHTTIAQESPADALNFPKIDASPMDIAIFRTADDEAVARVIYSRPYKRDREIFGKLVPYGQVWRTGANEATELTLYKDMTVGDATVKAGTYSIYTIPEEREWTIILNKSTHSWGAYEYSDVDDLVRIKVPVRNSPTHIENFSMAFAPQEQGADLLMGWDNKYVAVPFKSAN